MVDFIYDRFIGVVHVDGNQEGVALIKIKTRSLLPFNRIS